MALALAFTATAAAQQEQRARLLTQIDETAFADQYPVIALTRGIEGVVALRCQIAADGSSQCAATEETPAGFGFGPAAEAIAADWRFELARVNGAPTPGPYETRINFRLPAAGEPAPILRTAALTAQPGLLVGEQADFPYPLNAYVARIPGRAMLGCAQRSNARLDCAVDRETPEGYGFGERALEIVRRSYEERPQDRPSQAAFRIVIDFALTAADGTAPDAPPQYENRPDAETMRRLYPAAAAAQNLAGRANANCRINADRSLTCRAEDEAPAGSGFGEAAAAVAGQMRVTPAMFGQIGYEAGDRVLIPIDFQAE
jgi:protein TonB